MGIPNSLHLPTLIANPFGWLVRPAASVQGVERRNARLFSSLQLVILIALILAKLAAAGPEINLVLMAVAMTYVLGRTRYYRMAELAMLVMLSLAVISYFEPGHTYNNMELTSILSWLVLPVLLASMTSSLKTTAFSASISVMTLLLIPWFIPTLSLKVLLPSSSFVVTLVPLILLGVRHWAAMEKERQSELVNMNAHLREQAESLRIATAKAREAARLKGEFLANVSHELRTPLNAIIGFSDMLLMGMTGELTEPQRHKMLRLKENGVRLLSLINNVLDLTRIEARRIEVIHKPFSPDRLMKRLSAQMTVLAENARLTFETSVSPDLPPTLIGDEQRIEQVVINLLSNAFKFTEQGTVNLNFNVDRAARTWQIVVADTGIGIPPHALDLIFEEFRQLDGGSSRAYKGSGLGLAITRNLVRMMDGEIKVKNTLGEGSTFTVALPLIETVLDAKDPLSKVQQPIGV